MGKLVIGEDGVLFQQHVGIQVMEQKLLFGKIEQCSVLLDSDVNQI